jgi:enoyl-CoA hydratase/carnithine racemase
MTRKLVKWSPPYRGENVEQPVFDLIDLEKDGPIGRIILNSPDTRNPLGYERLLQIEMAAKLMELDDDIRVIIIKGDGPSFSAGYDITPVPPGEPKRNTPENGYVHPDRDGIWQSYDQEHLRVYTTLFDLQKPIIAQVQGYCLAGGSELAGFCDLRIVADDAKIGWPVGRNWSPGNLQYMPWLVGMTRAKYYMFTCEPISGKQAAEWAWASESVPADLLEARTEEIARKIALTPTDLIMMTKRSINRQFEIMGFKTGLATSVDHLALAVMRPGFTRGDGFIQKTREVGLTAALNWRDQTFGNSYRTAGKSTDELNAESGAQGGPAGADTALPDGETVEQYPGS